MKKKLILIAFLLFSTVGYADPVSQESLKAAYIYHFINFIEWNDSLSNYYVCVPDDPSLQEALTNSLKGKLINNRYVVVLGRSSLCHISISDEPAQSPTELTIGSLNRGALMEFRVIDNKLKFAVNLEKLKRSRLKISSQLLNLAILE